MAMINVSGTPHAYDLVVAPSVESPCTLVFIHGWLLSRSYWQPLIEHLVSSYTCLAYDLRGFGASQPAGSQIPWQDTLSMPPTLALVASDRSGYPASAPVDPLQSSSPIPDPLTHTAPQTFTPAAYVQDLAILLDQLNISNAWLIGHSLGGSIALWGAAQLFDRVKGVICINSGGGIYLEREFEKFRAAGQQMLQFRPPWLRQLPLVDLVFSRANVCHPIARRWGRQRIIDFVAAQPEAALGTLLDSTTEAEVHKLPQVVAQLQQPAYFITGSQDNIMEPRYVRHLASFHTLFGDCGENVIEIPDCGHFAMIEQSGQVADQVRSILYRHGL
ncbi:alpha/beta hydrolase [Leptolyngbya sp. 'hensonii']|uniref:alpha/beta fold hydrolase n=1 Tax=Leptolyngbya sp. 'hensonii' TaxID=1922337 RepID=UPI00094F7C37|nr:alpha/beta hydrolase [Leptolyngbya sp. 'hensonii']OLP17325.1 alpha/beta hydrolase [Leptolyngbya sp. 'hensonii']